MPVLSTSVIREAQQGHSEAAQLRLNACKDIPTFDTPQTAFEFASRIIASGAIPASETEDAMHVAMAQILDADYLASWNFAHLVGPHAKLKLQLKPIPISTPDEILEELTS